MPNPQEGHIFVIIIFLFKMIYYNTLRSLNKFIGFNVISMFINDLYGG